MQVPRKQHRRRRLNLGGSENSCVRHQAHHKDHVWSYDFVQDRTHAGKVFRILCVIDEFTRECLAIRVERRLNFRDVLDTLGELFVDVTNAERGAPLADGARLPQRDTSTAPTVEDALAQASLLVNGGGLAQLQTVTEELRGALEGREDRAVSVLDRTLDVLDQVDAATGDVDRALRSLDSVSRTLRQRRETINGVLRDVRPAARVLRRSTPRLVELLSEVESFAEVADDTVRRTREDLLSALRQAGPVLETLAGTRGEYADSLRALVRLAEELDGVAPGDYLNLSFDLRLTALSGGLPGLPILGDLLDDLLGGLVTALLGEEGLVDGLLDDLLGGLLGRAGGAR